MTNGAPNEELIKELNDSSMEVKANSSPESFRLVVNAYLSGMYCLVQPLNSPQVVPVLGPPVSLLPLDCKWHKWREV